MNTSMNAVRNVVKNPTPETEVVYPTYEELDKPIQELELKLTKRLLSEYKKSYSVPDHLLDMHKRLILPSTTLRYFIATLCKNTTDNIIIDNEPEIYCCNLPTMISFITDIKIKCDDGKYRSMKICMNEIYNQLTEEYGISLDRVRP